MAANNAATVVLKAINQRCEFNPIESPIKIPKSKTDLRFQNTTINHTDLETIDKKALVESRATSASMNKNQLEPPSSSNDAEAIVQRILDWSTNPEEPAIFALLGEYGMGKTITTQLVDTALRKRHKKSNNKPISLHFDLRNVTGMDKGEVPEIEKIIKDCIDSGWQHKDATVKTTTDDIISWCANGAVIIFDGLDEILVKLTESDGRILSSRLFKFLEDVQRANTNEGIEQLNQNIKLLVTCRTQYFKSLREQQNHFTGHERQNQKAEDILAMVLLPLTEEQVLTYLKHALPNVEITKVKELIDSVHNLKELSERPVTLKFIGELIPAIEEDVKLGKSINGVSLYRKMVERWLDRDSGKHHIKPEHKMELASHLAAYLWKTGNRRLPANQIEDWFHQWLDSNNRIRARYNSLHPEKLEEDLRTATFLARYDNEQGSAFGFAHTSLQEFFLADYLLQAIKENKPENWAIDLPSIETLEFLAQMLQAHDTEEFNKESELLVETLSQWRLQYQPKTSELLFKFGLLCYEKQVYGAKYLQIPLDGIQLPGADLQGLSINNFADGRKQNPFEQLPKLNLQRANFNNCNLRQFNCQHVDFEKATFENTDLHQARFYNCDLQNAELKNSHPWNAIFHQCCFGNVISSGQSVLPNKQTYGWDIISTNEHCPTLPPLLRKDSSSKKQIAPTFPHHISPVSHCAFSPDGNTIASASDDNTIKLWDAHSGKLLHSMESHNSIVRHCAFSPDGNTIASASSDKTIKLWDAHSGKLLHSMENHNAPINHCAFSPDGNIIASASDDSTIKLWNATSGKLLHSMENHSDWVNHCAFSPDGNTIASASDDSTMSFFSTQTEEVSHTYFHTKNNNYLSFNEQTHEIVDKSNHIWRYLVLLTEDEDGNPTSIPVW